VIIIRTRNDQSGAAILPDDRRCKRDARVQFICVFLARKG